jgi:hypothetical protein
MRADVVIEQQHMQHHITAPASCTTLLHCMVCLDVQICVDS